MQDSGVHRKFFSKKQPLENELWKRAFWCVTLRERVDLEAETSRTGF